MTTGPAEVEHVENGAAAASVQKLKLVGCENFVRHNPKTDKFPMHKFHHVEFWCSDATTTYKRFQAGLGMSLVAKSDMTTGNSLYASYVLQSNDLVCVFTAPYCRSVDHTGSKAPFPHYDQQQAYDFVNKHGLAVRAVGVAVDDAAEAYRISVAKGAHPVLAPMVIPKGGAEAGVQIVSEVKLYGDVVLRYISGAPEVPFIVSYEPVDEGPRTNFGLQRLDHCVGNTPNLIEVAEYMTQFTGLHEFSEFVSADVGTVDSGLNNMVLANNNEFVLLPVNEPTFGTPRKSQIQTYLEHNEGPGVQHLAFKTDDIFKTLRRMYAQPGGFDFMPKPVKTYYTNLRERIGDALTPEQYEAVEELGILVDKDDQGMILQIITKPVGDRPTIFCEVIQRVGCMTKVGEEADGTCKMEQASGCGGFGKGNFAELFKCVETFERMLDAAKQPQASSPAVCVM